MQLSSHLQRHKVQQCQPQTACLQTAAGTLLDICYQIKDTVEAVTPSLLAYRTLYCSFQEEAIDKTQKKCMEYLKPCYCVPLVHFLLEMLGL